MRDKLNCPNCGAPITGDKCEYCGTVFYDWSVLDTERPTYIKLKHNNTLVLAEVRMRSCELTVAPEYAKYTNCSDMQVVSSYDMEISAEFDVVGDDVKVIFMEE